MSNDFSVVGFQAVMNNVYGYEGIVIVAELSNQNFTFLSNQNNLESGNVSTTHTTAFSVNPWHLLIFMACPR